MAKKDNTTMWLLNKFTDINHERMDKHLDILSKKTGKSKLALELDMAKNFLVYGTGYTDYFRGNYAELSPEEKKTFVTARKYYNIINYLNDPKYTIVLHDKLIFNTFFSEYIKREFINLRVATVDEFKTFLSNKDYVFAKLSDGEGGYGITKINVDEIKDVEKLMELLKQKRQYLVEQAIIQCDEVNEINPNVVSSFRILTLYKDGKVHLLNNAFRMNQTAANVIGSTDDMYCSFGEDGKIDSNVIDDYANVYETHPLTGKPFSEVCIPDVKKAFDMVREAAKKIPQVRYIGWDVAFSTKGPVIVEGNEYPGFGIIQFYKLKDKRTGHLKELSDVLGDEMNNIKL